MTHVCTWRLRRETRMRRVIRSARDAARLATRSREGSTSTEWLSRTTLHRSQKIKSTLGNHEVQCIHTELRKSTSTCRVTSIDVTIHVDCPLPVVCVCVGVELGRRAPPPVFHALHRSRGLGVDGKVEDKVALAAGVHPERPLEAFPGSQRPGCRPHIQRRAPPQPHARLLHRCQPHCALPPCGGRPERQQRINEQDQG